MRVTRVQGDFKAKAIAGTHTVLIALDCKEDRRHGLLGFAFKREVAGATSGTRWLRSQKVFESIVPDPKKERDPVDPSQPKRFIPTNIRSRASCGATTRRSPTRATSSPSFRCTAGRARSSPARHRVRNPHREGIRPGPRRVVQPRRHREPGLRPRVQEQSPSEDEINDPGRRGTKWLSRGLLEACLDYIEETPPGDGLRVAAYEFTYAPVLDALKEAARPRRRRAHRLSRHRRDGTADAERERDRRPGSRTTRRRARSCSARTKTEDPAQQVHRPARERHEADEVWTGSTNFTPSGFLGQTNVGHLVDDRRPRSSTSRTGSCSRPTRTRHCARRASTKLTPDPPTLIPQKSTVQLFSPRAEVRRCSTGTADRIDDAAELGDVHRRLRRQRRSWSPPLAADTRLPALRADGEAADRRTLKARSTRTAIRDHLLRRAARRDLHDQGRQADARIKIKEFDLDKWFLKEEHFRPKNEASCSSCTRSSC